MTRLRDHFTLGSRLRYLAWRGMGSRSPLTAAFRTGERLSLRPPPSSDLATANEVFVGRVYAPPRPIPADAIRHVADLGANVGYSIVWWLRAFPLARVTAFEPHPVHCGQVKWHLAANRAADRVVLHEAAAGTADGTTTLSDAENQSSTVNVANGLTVAVRDVFAAVGAADLVKIDIEGAEYDILADPRFEALAPRVLVMEWHRTADPRSGPRWCEERLTGLGYAVEHTAGGGGYGTLWGFRGG